MMQAAIPIKPSAEHATSWLAALKAFLYVAVELCYESRARACLSPTPVVGSSLSSVQPEQCGKIEQ
jgi:hypothetical protein